jgi:hypothetical protein
MRPVSGLDRPAVQWFFVTIAMVLIAVALLEAVALRRARGEIASVRTSEINGRLELGRLQSTSARERSAREALSLEVARLRGGGRERSGPPTLTLLPLTTRGSNTPEPTLDAPGKEAAIELRLVLPARPARGGSYTIAIRAWTGGETIWSRGGLRAASIDGRPIVGALITGDVFAPGAYEVVLTTTSADGKVGDVAAYEVATRPSVQG